MKKLLLSAFVFVCISYAPSANAQTTADVLLLRIDKLILEMQQIKQQVEALTSGSAPTGQVQGVATTKVFTESLAYGETNDDIGRIQKLLATDPEIYPYGVVSGFFGPKTEEAIRNLQTRFNLDPVGVIGPATTALLEGYMRMYPDGNFPADALKQKPQVLGDSTTVTPTVPTTPTTPTGSNTTSANNPLRLVDIELDRGEAPVTVYFKDGKKESFVADGEDEGEIILYISHRLGIKESYVREVSSVDEHESDSDDADYDDDDAEDYIDDAEEEIEDAEDEILDAEDDGDDVDYALDTLDEAEDALNDAEDAFDDEDYDEAVKQAKEAIKLAKKAVDRIGDEEDNSGEKGDSDEIDSIVAEVDEDESEITVEYEDDTEYVFTVEEYKKDEIIEEVADELDMDEDDVEDIIEFDYGRIDTIDAIIGDGKTKVTVEYRSGVTLRFTVNEDDEDDIIEAVADELDEDEEDIEDVIDFDYL